MKTTPRIVSLIASATEIVHALGLSAFQVGRSHECDYPDSIRALPVCTAPKFDASGDSRQIDRLVKETLRDATSVYAIFDDILDELKPTHVLTQSQCRVCAVSIDDVQRALASRVAGNPIVVALEPNSLDDVWQDIHRVAKALGCEPQGKALGDKLQSRMQDIAERASASTRPTVACIEWIEPLMAAGN